MLVKFCYMSILSIVVQNDGRLKTTEIGTGLSKYILRNTYRTCILYNRSFCLKVVTKRD
jgi:hypothetical protein